MRKRTVKAKRPKPKDNGAVAKRETPRCLAVADRGIKTAGDFAGFMSDLIADIVADRIDTRKANASCNAGGKLLKAAELNHKYGRAANDSAETKVLTIAP